MRTRLLKYILGFILVIAIGYEVLVLIARPVPEHPYFASGTFLTIAHRGGCSLGPESTLYTFHRAVDLGVDVLEMDIRTTKDGEPVVIHDSTVDRITDGSGAVSTFTLAELKRLDAGYRWTPDHGRSFPLRGQGLTIPTLTEVLETFPGMRLNIEIKESDPVLLDGLCQRIRDFQKTHEVMIASVDVSQLKKFRTRCPHVATSFGASEAFLFYGLQWAHLEKIYSPSAQALQLPEYYGNTALITCRLLAAAQARNLRVHVWTVNDPRRMQQLVDLGVAGIMTDYPDRLLEILGRNPPAQDKSEQKNKIKHSTCGGMTAGKLP